MVVDSKSRSNDDSSSVNLMLAKKINQIMKVIYTTNRTTILIFSERSAHIQDQLSKKVTTEKSRFVFTWWIKCVR
jgi:hypothetical protein